MLCLTSNVVYLAERDPSCFARARESLRSMDELFSSASLCRCNQSFKAANEVVQSAVLELVFGRTFRKRVDRSSQPSPRFAVAVDHFEFVCQISRAFEFGTSDEQGLHIPRRIKHSCSAELSRLRFARSVCTRDEKTFSVPRDALKNETDGDQIELVPKFCVDDQTWRVRGSRQHESGSKRPEGCLCARHG